MPHMHTTLGFAGSDWACVTVALMPLWLPVLVLLVLPPLLRWDDARRNKIKNRPGFPVKQPEDQPRKRP